MKVTFKFPLIANSTPYWLVWNREHLGRTEIIAKLADYGSATNLMNQFALCFDNARYSSCGEVGDGDSLHLYKITKGKKEIINTRVF